MGPEANTQLLLKATDLLRALFDGLAARGYRLSEYEARCVLPCLVERSGQPNSAVNAAMRELLQKAAGLYPPPRLALALKARAGAGAARGRGAAAAKRLLRPLRSRRCRRPRAAQRLTCYFCRP
jgi:hypothetical protein